MGKAFGTKSDARLEKEFDSEFPSYDGQATETERDVLYSLQVHDSLTENSVTDAVQPLLEQNEEKEALRVINQKLEEQEKGRNERDSINSEGETVEEDYPFLFGARETLVQDLESEGLDNKKRAVLASVTSTIGYLAGSMLENFGNETPVQHYAQEINQGVETAQDAASSYPSALGAGLAAGLAIGADLIYRSSKTEDKENLREL